jgi:hypothetical protein
VIHYVGGTILERFDFVLTKATPKRCWINLVTEITRPPSIKIVQRRAYFGLSLVFTVDLSYVLKQMVSSIEFQAHSKTSHDVMKLQMLLTWFEFTAEWTDRPSENDGLSAAQPDLRGGVDAFVSNPFPPSPESF